MAIDMKTALRAAMDAQGLTDNDTRAGIAGIAVGESNMSMHVETGYSHTSNERIREVFPSLTSSLSDAELNQIKSTDQTWFEFVYGPQSRTGKELGNTEAGDGYKYRGRGFIQLTGRANYARYAAKIGRPDVVANPDLALDPDVSAALTVAYIKDRYHGGGFSSLLRCVGNNTPDIEATKTRFYEEFKASGEFDYGKPPAPPVEAPPMPEKPSMVREVLNKVEAIVAPPSAPTAAPAPAAPQLKLLQAMTKAQVKAFQAQYATEFALQVDGIVGRQTTLAWVHVFQRSNPPLYDDGVIGPETQAAMDKVYG